jgi:hypothetical protein
MSQRNRQLVGMVMGLAMLNATFAPPIAFAAANETVQHERAMATTETVELFRTDGRLDQRFEGTGFAGRVGAQTAALRRVSPQVLDTLESALRAWASRSKRGLLSVAMSLQVIQALRAPTTSEFHSRIKALPIEVTSKKTTDSLERTGTVTEYR